MERATVAASFVTALIDYAVGRGCERESLMLRAAISSEQLGSPHQRVPLDNYLLLMRAAKDACADPALALHFGESVDIREMSIASLLAQSCETAGDALAAVNRYGRLDADVDTSGLDRLQLVRKSNQLWLVDVRTNANASPELTESSFARMISAGRRAGMEFPLREVHVTHDEPSYAAEYDRIFKVPVRFGRDWNALCTDASMLAQKIAVQPAFAGRLLTERADSLLAELDHGKSVSSQLEAVLMPRLVQGGAKMDAAARALGLSRATLYRRLGTEGVTFEQVLDRLRKRMARDYLADRRLSVSEIAHRLGFADRSSFSKTFQRWNGVNPGAWRNAAGEDR